MKDSTYCGFGKSGFLKPPYWFFIDASCKIHDDNYKKGGTEEDRLTADVGFLKYMLKDISSMVCYKHKRKAVLWAVIYYLLVRAFGWITFNTKKN